MPMLIAHNRERRRILIAAAFFVLAASLFAVAAHAQVSLDFPTNFAGFSSQDIKVTIQNIVRIVLGFVGFIFLLLILYGGFVWMLSQGEERKIARAKQIIVSATVGLILTLSAYAIASFIIRSFGGATGPGGPGGGGGGPTGFGVALGAGVLESHYPGRNATDVPRNTSIFITFKEAMNVGTLCDVSNQVVETNIIIEDINARVPADSNDPGNDDVLEGVSCAPVAGSNDQTFKFVPSANLGLSTDSVTYRVTLTGGIQTAQNKVALPIPYQWQFTVGTFIDSTPPTVVSVVPLSGTYPRNILVQVTFSEPVDPSSASGQTSATPPFDNIVLDDGTGPVQGSYISGNQYRTTEFVSNDLCGQNSCGGDVYCLPAPAAPPPATLTIDGTVTNRIMDMAGNQLDQDSILAGNQEFTWSFETNNTLDLNPPVMQARAPRQGSSNVDLFSPLETSFSKLLSVGSVITNNAGLSRQGFNDNIGYWVSVESFTTSTPPYSKIFIHHEPFTPLTQYHPGVDSEIKDIFQNCYYPAGCDNNGDGIADPGACNLAPF